MSIICVSPKIVAAKHSKIALAAVEEAAIEDRFETVDSLRIGLIADTHMPGTIASLWPQIYDGFADVDCILHAGDLHVAAVIDELEAMAPTYVCAGNGDLDVRHHRLQERWEGNLAGLNVGLIHRFPTPRRADEARLEKKLTQHFGHTGLEVVIYGHTHLAEVHSVAGRTYINPGSPTLPNNQSTRHGTVGFLNIRPEGAEVELMQINDDGLELVVSHVI